MPLFELFPVLEERLPFVSLGKYPTPILKLDKLGEKIGVPKLYIKQDGLTARPFGGNKIRKLEFVLGDALRQGAKEVLTFGFAGSNHCLATALCAKKLGLRSISMLLPQPNAHYVRRNLLMSLHAGAELHLYPNKPLLSMGTTVQLLRHRLKTGKAPYLIPPGGSSPAGVVGFVNAAFELRNQVERGEMPEPDLIYLGMGTAGTLVGLLIGLGILKMKTRVMPVRVVDEKFTDIHTVFQLHGRTISLLGSAAAVFPGLELSAKDVEIVADFLGEGYARFTREGKQAVTLLEETEGIKLDGTYTGKTFAALLAAAKEGKLKNKVVLFWNTLNAHDFSHSIKDMDYQQLPKSLHHYFEQEVQPLDR